MKTCWTAGLTPDETVEVRKDYVGSVILRRRLKKLLTDKTQTAITKSLGSSGYEKPNWAYQQADLIGYQRAISEIISLISEDTVEK